jgi:transposase-like protein
MKMKNTGKRYHEEFKADLIRLVFEEKHSVASIKKDFGVNHQTIKK